MRLKIHHIEFLPGCPTLQGEAHAKDIEILNDITYGTEIVNLIWEYSTSKCNIDNFFPKVIHKGPSPELYLRLAFLYTAGRAA